MNHNMRKMYTEQQVADIVKRAIASGEISGGTKLYKHVVSFKYNSAVHTFTVITTESKSLGNIPSFNSISLPPLNFPKISVQGSPSDIAETYLFEISGGNYGSLAYNFTGIRNSGTAMISVQITSGISEVTDTVTPF